MSPVSTPAGLSNEDVAVAVSRAGREGTQRPLAGKVVLVVGGAHNFGGQISRDLAMAGATLAVHFHRDANAQAARETVAEATAAGVDAFALQGDLTSAAEVRRLFDAVLDRHGSLYATVNTAGVVLTKPIAETSEVEYDWNLAVNAKLAFFVMQEAAKRTEDGGKILTVLTSLLAIYAGTRATYAGGTAAVEQYTRALSREIAGRSISVNAIAPGPMDSEFFFNAAQPGEADLVKSTTMNGQLTRVEDIVPWVRFLLTDGWWLNGQTLFVNGGFATR